MIYVIFLITSLIPNNNNITNNYITTINNFNFRNSYSFSKEAILESYRDIFYNRHNDKDYKIKLDLIKEIL